MYNCNEVLNNTLKEIVPIEKSSPKYCECWFNVKNDTKNILKDNIVLNIETNNNAKVVLNNTIDQLTKYSKSNNNRQQSIIESYVENIKKLIERMEER